MANNRSISSVFLREAERLAAVNKQTATAVARAKQDLARRLPVEARRDMQQEYALKAGRISQGLRATSSSDGVTLVASADPIGLIEFDGRDGGGRGGEGASAKIFAAEGRHTYAGSFIATGLHGNRQIFSRKIVGGRRAGRLPIGALFGPSTAGMLRKGDRIERLGDFSQTILAQRFASIILAFEQS